MFLLYMLFLSVSHFKISATTDPLDHSRLHYTSSTPPLLSRTNSVSSTESVANRSVANSSNRETKALLQQIRFLSSAVIKLLTDKAQQELQSINQQNHNNLSQYLLQQQFHTQCRTIFFKHIESAIAIFHFDLNAQRTLTFILDIYDGQPIDTSSILDVHNIHRVMKNIYNKLII